jgi:nucleoid DNA-binding protein
MNQSASHTREIIELIVQQSGITKKLAAELLHAIPGIIEEGLKKDGEVRVKGLGTFRMRWTRGRIGRNLKTGERVEIPSHSRVIFLPEKAFKEYINRDNRLLGYKIIPPAENSPSIGEMTAETRSIPETITQLTEPEPEPGMHHQSRISPEPLPVAGTKHGSVIEPEIETPSGKRRIHWIVPAVITVIIILSFVFYFRNFHTGQRSAVSSQQSLVSSQQSAVGGQQAAVGSQQAVEPIPKSEIINPNSELKTKNLNLKTIPEGTRLFKLAREIYGNPYLWILIYKENQDKITDPDMVISGSELVVPVLEGTPDRLSRNDSLAVSEGYRLVYEYFKAKDDPRTKDFYMAMKRYQPKGHGLTSGL